MTASNLHLDKIRVIPLIRYSSESLFAEPGRQSDSGWTKNTIVSEARERLLSAAIVLYTELPRESLRVSASPSATN